MSVDMPKMTLNTEEGAVEVPSNSEPKISQPATSPSLAEKNPAYFDLTSELPSKFKFYNFDTLSARRFRTPEILKLYEAQQQSNFALIAEAVGATIDPSISVLDLTLGDFYFILYWQKINSFKKAPYKLAFSCTSPEHIKGVIEKVKTRESLLNEFTIRKISELTVQYPDIEKVEELHDTVLKEYNVYLYPCTVRDFIASSNYLQEVGEIEDEINSEETPEEKKPILKARKAALDNEFFMYDFASYISNYHGATLKDKMNFLRNFDADADFLSYIDDFIKATEHGVQETAALRCKECNALVEVSISINALQFFPDTLRNNVIG